MPNDPIDIRLADYINSVPDLSELKIGFVRESEGIYHFGQKRVYLRVDNDRISVRTGGGFLSMEEFIA